MLAGHPRHPHCIEGPSRAFGPGAIRVHGPRHGPGKCLTHAGFEGDSAAWESRGDGLGLPASHVLAKPLLPSCRAMVILRVAYLLRGEVQFLTGGMGHVSSRLARAALRSSPKARDPAHKGRLTWCDSRADGIVRMKVTESSSLDVLEGTRCSRARVPFWFPCPITPSGRAKGRRPPSQRGIA